MKRGRWPDTSVIDPRALGGHIRGMSRFVVLLSALVLSACEKNKVVDAEPRGPPPPMTTLKCTVLMPSGWTASASTMPDHVAEAIANAPNLRGILVAREATESTVAEATESAKQRTLASWKSRPDFTLLREVPLGEGRLLAFQWRPQPSAPIERHLVAVLPNTGKILIVLIDDDGSTPEAHLLGAVTTMKCVPR